MPNGYHDDPSIDLIVHRHTEHGQPRFRTLQGSGGVVSVHMEHDRGYAYEPRWDAVELAPLVRSRRERPTRAEVDALAADLVAKVTALLSSEPDSRVHATRGSAFLAVDGFCVALGGYHVYTRSAGRRFERVEPPRGRLDDALAQLLEAHPEQSHLAHDTHVAVERGLLMHEPDACVIDLDPVVEWIASTAPLHEHPLWEEIARVPLDSVDSCGHLLVALRKDAVKRGTDHLVIRGRRSPPAAPKVATDVSKASALDDLPGGDLRVVWGPEIGRPHFLYSECLIGRAKDCDIDLDDDKVSRHHARITRIDGRYELRDLGSMNGTFVNGHQSERCWLEDGDRITIGTHRFQFWSGHTIIYEPHLRRHDDRHIIAALAREAPRATSGEQEVSLVLFDLDHLHRLNGDVGFKVADAVLANVESVARRTLRPGDTLSRIGGEEFAIVLPGLGVEAARRFAEDVRRAVDASSLVAEGREIRMTISCGVAAWSSRTSRPWQLMREVEARLFEAKASGRNQVR